MILSLKTLINIKDPGQRIKDFAIDCCKTKGVPRVCLGICVPAGAVPTRRKKKKIKCSKHANKMFTCKNGKTY